MEPEHHTAGGPSAADRKVFRLPGALIAWWAWVALGVACLIDLAVSARSHASAEIAVTVLLITGVAYACALRPRVVADADAVTVHNPLRDHRVPWGSVTEVDLAESVRVHYLPEPGAQREKVIHSWALYAQRRARLRMDLMQRAGPAGSIQRGPQGGPQSGPQGGPQSGPQRGPEPAMARSPFSAFSFSSSDAPSARPLPTAQVMCTELSELARQARDRGAAAGPRVVRWAWQPAVAMLAPAVALVLVITLTH